jgi:hypothetical protein
MFFKHCLVFVRLSYSDRGQLLFMLARLRQNATEVRLYGVSVEPHVGTRELLNQFSYLGVSLERYEAFKLLLRLNNNMRILRETCHAFLCISGIIFA